MKQVAAVQAVAVGTRIGAWAGCPLWFSKGRIDCCCFDEDCTALRCAGLTIGRVVGTMTGTAGVLMTGAPARSLACTSSSFRPAGSYATGAVPIL